MKPNGKVSKGTKKGKATMGTRTTGSSVDGEKVWTATLDAALRAAMTAVGQGTWSDVAAHVEGRSDTQCMNRWIFLQERDADLKTGPFTEAEDKQILRLLATHGRKWGDIAKELGRGAKQVQNHCTSGPFSLIVQNQFPANPRK